MTKLRIKSRPSHFPFGQASSPSGRSTMSHSISLKGEWQRSIPDKGMVWAKAWGSLFRKPGEGPMTWKWSYTWDKANHCWGHPTCWKVLESGQEFELNPLLTMSHQSLWGRTCQCLGCCTPYSQQIQCQFEQSPCLFTVMAHRGHEREPLGTIRPKVPEGKPTGVWVLSNVLSTEEEGSGEVEKQQKRWPWPQGIYSPARERRHSHM